MGADKNSSRRRWVLQQYEHGIQHTSPTHYPSKPSPRSHWSATERRNQLPTSQTRERSGTPKLESTDQHRSGRCNTPVRPVSARKPQNTKQAYQADPNSKQQQHRTIANTPKRSPEQKPNKGCTGQTGERHRSDRCDQGFSR
jgi:hypothetical protein